MYHPPPLGGPRFRTIRLLLNPVTPLLHFLAEWEREVVGSLPTEQPLVARRAAPVPQASQGAQLIGRPVAHTNE